jgi:hypothetical protein
MDDLKAAALRTAEELVEVVKSKRQPTFDDWYHIIAAALLDARADALVEARKTMRKRVWVHWGCASTLGELPDGAVPCWWIDEAVPNLRRIAQELRSK